MAFERVGVRVVVEGLGAFENDSRRFNTALERMGRGAQLLSAPLGLAGSALKAVGGFLGNVATIATGIIAANVFGRIVQGLSDMAGAAFKAASEFQTLTIRFEGLIARELVADFERLHSTFEETFILDDEAIAKTRDQIAAIGDNIVDTEAQLGILQQRLAEQAGKEGTAESTIASTTDQIRREERALADLRSELSAARTELAALVSGEQGAQVVTRQIVNETLDFRDALEQAKGPAQELLQFIKETAVTTPFTVESLAKTLATAQAMGFTTDKAKELTLAIGNFTAGMGLSQDVMERIVYNFGQMVQQGKVTSTELRDLARGALVPVTDVLREMQKRLGDTRPFDQFREDAAEGVLPVTEFFEAFISIANTDFPGAMQRMSRTFQGVTSNVKDFVQAILGAELLGPIVQRFTDIAAEALENLLTPEFREGFQRIGKTIAATFDFVAEVARKVLLPAISEFFRALGIGEFSVESVMILIQRFGLFLAKLIEIGAGVIVFFARLLPRAVETGRGAFQFVQTALLAIRDALTNLSPFFAPIIEGATRLFKSFVDHAPEALQNVRLFIDFIKENFAPTVAVIAANIGGILTRLADLWAEHGAKIQAVVQVAFRIIAVTIQGTITLISGIINAFLAALQGDWDGVFRALASSVASFIDLATRIVGSNFEEFIQVWRTNFELLGAIIKGMLDLAIERFIGFFVGIKDLVVAGFGGIITAVGEILELGSPSKRFAEFGRSMMEGLAEGIMQSISLPTVASQVAIAQTMSPRSAALAGGGTTTNNHFGMTINTSAPVEPIMADYRLMALQGERRG